MRRLSEREQERDRTVHALGDGTFLHPGDNSPTAVQLERSPTQLFGVMTLVSLVDATELGNGYETWSAFPAGRASPAHFGPFKNQGDCVSYFNNGK